MELPEVITPKQFKYYAETLLCIKFDLNIILKIKTTYNIKRTVRGTNLNIGLWVIGVPGRGFAFSSFL